MSGWHRHLLWNFFPSKLNYLFTKNASMCYFVEVGRKRSKISWSSKCKRSGNGALDSGQWWSGAPLQSVSLPQLLSSKSALSFQISFPWILRCVVLELERKLRSGRFEEEIPCFTSHLLLTAHSYRCYLVLDINSSLLITLLSSFEPVQPFCGPVPAARTIHST